MGEVVIVEGGGVQPRSDKSLYFFRQGGHRTVVRVYPNPVIISGEVAIIGEWGVQVSQGRESVFPFENSS